MFIHVPTDEADLPDRSGYVPLIPPLFGRVDVHAPQLPVVAVARVLVALHLERVVLDVVDGGQDDPLVVVLYSGQDRLGPEQSVNTHMYTRTTGQTRHGAPPEISTFSPSRL